MMKKIIVILLIFTAQITFGQGGYDRIYIVSQDSAFPPEGVNGLTQPSNMDIPSTIAEDTKAYADGYLATIIEDALNHDNENILILFKVDTLVKTNRPLPQLENNINLDNWYKIQDPNDFTNVKQGIIKVKEFDDYMLKNKDNSWYENLTITTSVNDHTPLITFYHYRYDAGSVRNCKIKNVQLPIMPIHIICSDDYDEAWKTFLFSNKIDSIKHLCNQKEIVYYSFIQPYKTSIYFVDFYNSNTNGDLLNRIYSDTIIAKDLGVDTTYASAIIDYHGKRLAMTVTGIDNNRGTSHATYFDNHKLKRCFYIQASKNNKCINSGIKFEALIEGYFSRCYGDYEWDFGDGTIITKHEKGGMRIEHTYTQAGSYDVTVKLHVNCENEIYEDTSTLHINVNECHNIDLQSPLQSCINDTVAFKAIVKDYLNCEDITYVWDFGDGRNTKGLTPDINYIYTEAGSYVVKLTVICGNNKHRETVYKKIDIKSCSTEVGECADCIGTFSPLPMGKYLVSGWVKEDIEGPVQNYEHSDITVLCYGDTWDEGENRYEYISSDTLRIDTLRSSGQIIDGWQKIEQVINIPANTKTIEIQLNNRYKEAVEVFFDDIRFQPFNSTMKSYVYDFSSGKLKAENDENNYATFYEYDEEGNLVRVKKETVRGIMTIQESRNSTKTKN